MLVNVMIYALNITIVAMIMRLCVQEVVMVVHQVQKFVMMVSIMMVMDM